MPCPLIHHARCPRIAWLAETGVGSVGRFIDVSANIGNIRRGEARLGSALVFASRAVRCG